MNALNRQLFALSLDECTFASRGFRGGDAGAQQRLEQVGRTFLEGYHLALEEDRVERLAVRLNAMEAEQQGVAFEGAAMGLALLGYLMPWRRSRFQAFLAGPAQAHVYMVHVGAGWAMARLRKRMERPPKWLDSLLGWLALDGYGFHEGYFHWPRTVERQAPPARLTGYARRVFDQGLGRSLWFVHGADIDRIAACIAAFPPPRQADLWSGVGLACAYAGGVGRFEIEALCDRAGLFRSQIAQGAAFAAEARQHAGNPAAHTDDACRVLCGLSAADAARIPVEALTDLPADDAVPAYEVWRQRIQSCLEREVVNRCSHSSPEDTVTPRASSPRR
jgi:hypothetical protein